MNTVESIPNAKRTFNALRSLGYDLNASVADLVDNSISAKATNINVIFKRKDGNFFLRLYDDGYGMDEEKLVEAMRLGTESEYDEGDLGKFGMGMKTASLSHCNVLTVISKTKRAFSVGYKWDMDHIAKTNKWELIKLNEEDIDEYLANLDYQLPNQGTVVCWDDLFLLDEAYNSYSSERYAENYYYRILGKLKLHLSMVFHRFLDQTMVQCENINIVVNGDELKPWDPFCRDEPATRKVKLEDNLAKLSIDEYDSLIKINGFVLPSKDNFSSTDSWKNGKGLLSWNDAQGYYIYRENRLIRYGGWQATMAKDEHIKLARLSIDINSELDDLFQVTVNKNNVQFPEVLYNHMKNKVNKIVVKQAKKAYRNSPNKPEVSNRFRIKSKKLDEFTKGLTNEGNITTKVDEISETFDVEVFNQNGRWLSNQVQEFMEYGTNRDFEIVSGVVENGYLWKILGNANEKFKVIINEKHPFYTKIYESGNNKSVTAAVDALIVSLAFAELFNKNEENSHLLDTFKTVCANTLKELVNKDII